MGLKRLIRTSKLSTKKRKMRKKNCLITALVVTVLVNFYMLYHSTLFRSPDSKAPAPKRAPVYTTNNNFIDDHERVDRFQMRKERLPSICSTKRTEYEQSMNLCKDSRRVHPMYSTKSVEPGLVGYLIKHNAVSILKNMLFQAIRPGKRGVKNPYLVEEKDFSELLETDTHDLPFHEFWNVQNITRFTFGRDPFARLLSSYLDSLYISNPIQWRLLAKKIRPRDSSQCITNITFSEYVNYYLELVRESKCTERLLLLNYQQADPCKVKYHFIGKFEHLEHDVKAMLDKVNMLRNFSFPHFKTDGDVTQITSLIQKIFDNKKDILACGVTLESAIKRMWRRLQVKGILGKYDTPPIGIRDDNQQSVIQTTVMKAYLMGNQYGREDNRNDALKEAYSHLSITTIAELQHVFQLDVELFGYDIYPYYIRSANHYANSKGKTFSFLEL